MKDSSMQKKLRRKSKPNGYFGDIIGESEKMQAVYGLIKVISPTSTTVLLTGETGTGKELVARAIHHNSQRKYKSFVKLDCTALPVTLLESELFGYKKGAFTDARTNKPGKFELADEGTIFLDEIGEIPWSIQAKLLRVLEEFAFEPLGSIETVRVNVRLIAATNRDLQKAMEQGVFRKDLYYRLNVFSIRLPALRERKDDIPLLVTNFVEYFNEVSDKAISSVSKASMDLLCKYEWPGNVRQLRHALEYAFIYCKGAVIQPEHLPEEITRKLSDLSDILDKDNPREELERRMILEALKKHGFSRSRVANILKMSRTTLWRKIKKYKLQ